MLYGIILPPAPASSSTYQGCLTSGNSCLGCGLGREYPCRRQTLKMGLPGDTFSAEDEAASAIVAVDHKGTPVLVTIACESRTGGPRVHSGSVPLNAHDVGCVNEQESLFFFHAV